MKEYIVKADFITEGGELVLPDIVSELIRCDDCKFYETCLIRISLPVGNDYCGNATMRLERINNEQNCTL